jgi:hypothetical protein
VRGFVTSASDAGGRVLSPKLGPRIGSWTHHVPLNRGMSCSFDFKGYLASICPEDEFDICVLTGGLVNHTIRATRRTATGGKTGPSVIRDKPSFIIKYAPGYIAALGESAPFSQYRQVHSIGGRRLIIDHREPCIRSNREYCTFQLPVQDTSPRPCTSITPP